MKSCWFCINPAAAASFTPSATFHEAEERMLLHKKLMELAAEGATLHNMSALFMLLPNLEAALRTDQGSGE